MNSSHILACALVLALTGAAGAMSVPIETISVDPTSTSPTFFATTLDSGRLYSIEVTGSYQLFVPNVPLWVADAEFDSFDGFTTVANGGRDLLAVYGSTIGVAPTFVATPNAQDIAWSTVYNPAHVYSFELTGNGGSLGFIVDDDFHPDNEGDFRVSLRALPEPSSIALIGIGFGLVVGLRRKKRIS